MCILQPGPDFLFFLRNVEPFFAPNVKIQLGKILRKIVFSPPQGRLIFLTVGFFLIIEPENSGKSRFGIFGLLEAFFP